MINPQVFPRELARTIIMHAITHNQRTGQYLFNMLQEPIRNEVTGKDWDPFEKEMSQYQIEKWFEDHIVFGSDGKMIALFDESGFLWERK